MTQVSRAMFEAHLDLDARAAHVAGRLEVALGQADSPLLFLFRYAAWNAEFGSGVTSLAGKIGRVRHLFLDPFEPVVALADRSAQVAARVFDAARDEFGDTNTDWHHTHRCLAQRMLVVVQKSHGAPSSATLEEPLWLQQLIDDVATGYGLDGPDDPRGIYHALGYHLASELLADQEFSLLDRAMRQHWGSLVGELEAAGAYHWIDLHSGLGAAVEADHFDLAMDSLRLALKYTAPEKRTGLVAHMFTGFDVFAADQHEFFERVTEGPL